MSSIGNQPLANCIVFFRFAFEDCQLPDDVADLFQAIDMALVAKKPRVVLNRRFGKLRQARSKIFQRLILWLEIPDVKLRARRSGVYWAWRIWWRASCMLQSGAKAHVAFGMNKTGRPSSQGFTRAEDAAIYAHYMLDTGQAPSIDEAVHFAATMYLARKDETERAIPLALAIGPEGRAESVMLSAGKRGGILKKA